MEQKKIPINIFVKYLVCNVDDNKDTIISVCSANSQLAPVSPLLPVLISQLTIRYLARQPIKVTLSVNMSTTCQLHVNKATSAEFYIHFYILFKSIP